MVELLGSFTTQILFLFGFVYLFSFLIGKLNLLILSLQNDTKIYHKVTSLIGVPTHELGHASMCLLFRHQIDEIVLLTFDSDTELGHVSHTYNRNNIYQKIGTYFIGIAPVYFGIIVMFLSIFLFNSTLASDLITKIFNISKSFNDIFDINLIKEIFSLVFDFIKNIFQFSNFTHILFWLMIYILISVASHIEMSIADINNSLTGLPYLIIFLAVLDLILFIFSKIALTAVTNFIISISLFIIISIIILLVPLLIVLIILLIKNLIINIINNRY